MKNTINEVSKNAKKNPVQFPESSNDIFSGSVEAACMVCQHMGHILGFNTQSHHCCRGCLCCQPSVNAGYLSCTQSGRLIVF